MYGWKGRHDMNKETVIPVYSKVYYLVDNGLADIYKDQRLDLRKFEVFVYTYM